MNGARRPIVRAGFGESVGRFAAAAIALAVLFASDGTASEAHETTRRVRSLSMLDIRIASPWNDRPFDLEGLVGAAGLTDRAGSESSWSVSFERRTASDAYGERGSLAAVFPGAVLGLIRGAVPAAISEDAEGATEPEPYYRYRSRARGGTALTAAVSAGAALWTVAGARARAGSLGFRFGVAGDPARAARTGLAVFASRTEMRLPDSGPYAATESDEVGFELGQAWQGGGSDVVFWIGPSLARLPDADRSGSATSVLRGGLTVLQRTEWLESGAALTAATSRPSSATGQVSSYDVRPFVRHVSDRPYGIVAGAEGRLRRSGTSNGYVLFEEERRIVVGAGYRQEEWGGGVEAELGDRRIGTPVRMPTSLRSHTEVRLGLDARATPSISIRGGLRGRLFREILGRDESENATTFGGALGVGWTGASHWFDLGLVADGYLGSTLTGARRAARTRLSVEWGRRW